MWIAQAIELGDLDPPWVQRDLRARCQRPKTAFARNSVPSQNQQRHGDGEIFLEQSRSI